MAALLGGAGGGAVAIELTPEDEAAIERLMALVSCGVGRWRACNVGLAAAARQAARNGLGELLPDSE